MNYLSLHVQHDLTEQILLLLSRKIFSSVKNYFSKSFLSAQQRLLMILLDKKA